MKLLECHIENFGAFHDFDLTFNDGLNVVMQPNGWGKTTLAAFVKAMFYGFDGKRVRNVSENERLRYKPWQGGAYGGYLDFEANGRELRVARTFGATKGRDTYKLVDLRTETSVVSEVGEDLGEWLFGLDANAFQKSVYIVQNGFDADGSATGLRNRLNSLVNEADDVAGLDAALKALDERRKFYKKTGNRGEIADISARLTSLVDASARAAGRIAGLKDAQSQIDSVAQQVAEIDARIAEVGAAAGAEQEKRQQREALAKVGAQLQGRVAAARGEYEAAMVDAGGKVPEQEELDAALAAANAAQVAEGELSSAQTSAAEIERERAGLRHDLQKLPAKDELEARREQARELAAKEKAARATEAPADEAFEALCAAVQDDPGLVVRAKQAVAGCAQAMEAQERVSASKAELSAARAGWEERKRQIIRLAEEARAAKGACEGDVDTDALRIDAATLHRLSAEFSLARKHADEAQAGLDMLLAEFPEDPDVDWAARARDIDEAAESVKSAAGKAAEMRAQAQDAEREVATLREEAAEARAAAGQVSSPAPAQPSRVPGIACVVAGFALAAAGFALGGMVALLAAGAVAVLLGIVLLAKSGKANPPQVNVVETSEPSDAEAKIDAAGARARAAASAAQQAEDAAAAAEQALRETLGSAFPAEELGEDLLFEAVCLKARASGLEEGSAAIAKKRSEVDEAKDLLRGAESGIKEVLARHEGLPADADKAASAIDAAIAAHDAAERKAREADRALLTAVRREAGGDADVEAFLSGIESFVPRQEARILADSQKDERAVAEYAELLNAALKPFGIPAVGPSELALGRERLQSALEDFGRKSEAARKSEESAAADASAVAALRADLEVWARMVGVAGVDALDEDWFRAALEAAANDEKLSWKGAEAQARTAKASEELAARLSEVSRFLVTYGGAAAETSEHARASVRRVAARAEAVRTKKSELDAASSQLAEWRDKNRAVLQEGEQSARAANDSARELEGLRTRRDALVRARAQIEEQRSAALAGLEGNLAAKQEVELLSKKRQKANAALFTVQKTAEYLDAARKGLDGRYLGDLASRFGDYANAWLEGERIDAEVDADFGVAIYDGAKAHDVAGYSTGYRDLLDVCLRMALVDTIFQAELPVLIMDDPFATLDEQKIGRALLMLDSLAQKFQIIYFTCHPSRVEGAQVAVAAQVGERASFVLPEQHARREMPRARARREAEERAKAQAELVASFAVVPVTAGRASILPAGSRRTVASNLVQVEFQFDPAAGERDNSFEVFFIDEKGRALCERQTVQVMGGQVVPDRLRFALTTRPDSGSAYDLIVHEDGRGPAELAARVPYKAQVAFANDLFDL